MALVQHHKVVAQLPAQLEPNSVYFVRSGAGYDQYVTNDAGIVVAYPMNPPGTANTDKTEVFLGVPATLPSNPALVFSQVNIGGQAAYRMQVSDGAA